MLMIYGKGSGSLQFRPMNMQDEFQFKVNKIDALVYQESQREELEKYVKELNNSTFSIMEGYEYEIREA